MKCNTKTCDFYDTKEGNNCQYYKNVDYCSDRKLNQSYKDDMVNKEYWSDEFKTRIKEEGMKL
jgi:hypothetical protein